MKNTVNFIGQGMNSNEHFRTRGKYEQVPTQTFNEFKFK